MNEFQCVSDYRDSLKVEHTLVNDLVSLTVRSHELNSTLYVNLSKFEIKQLRKELKRLEKQLG